MRLHNSRRISNRLAIIALVATTLPTLVTDAGSATTTRVYLPTEELRLPHDGNTALIEFPLTLQPGESQFIEARLAARSETIGNIEQRAFVRCFDDAGRPIGPEVHASRNHEGTDYPGVTTDSYVRTTDDQRILSLTAHHLLTAPEDGTSPQRYKCTLFGGAGDQDRAGKSLVAIRSVKDHTGAELTGTWLEAPEGSTTGTQWVDMSSTETDEQNCQPTDLYERCQPRVCESNGTGDCQYILPSADPSAVHILEAKIAKSHIHPGWAGDGGLATVFADFEMTTCYRGTKSCLDSVSRHGLPMNAALTHVLFRLEVAEIDSSGRPDGCRGPADSSQAPGWTFHPPPGDGYEGGDYKRETIRDDAHHKKFYRAVTRQLSSDPECDRLLVRVYIEAEDGQPIKIDASRLSNGVVSKTYTNAIAWLTPTTTPPGSSHFSDIEGNRHAEMIDSIAEAGITSGCDPAGTRYCPADAVGRGQMATFLSRALELPAASRDFFRDDNGTTHEDAINRIAEAGITTGFADGTFRPSESLPRDQMASFLARAFGTPVVDGNRFADVSGTHSGPINSIAEAGITLGCNSAGTLYCPDDTVRRDQMASFLGRALGFNTSA